MVSVCVVKCKGRSDGLPKKLSQHSAGGAEENHEKQQSGQLILWMRYF